jgi:hypothetical protein
MLMVKHTLEECTSSAHATRITCHDHLALCVVLHTSLHLAALLLTLLLLLPHAGQVWVSCCGRLRVVPDDLKAQRRPYPGRVTIFCCEAMGW